MQRIAGARTGVVGAVVVALLAAGCGGGGSDESPSEAAATHSESEAASEAPSEPAPEPSATSEAASAEELLAGAEGPDGYEDEDRFGEGTDPGLMYAYELTVLTQAFDPAPEIQRAKDAGLGSVAYRSWVQQVEDRQNAASVMVADFGDEESARAEFEYLAGLAGAVQNAEPIGSATGSEFALTAAFGMVQINPSTGQQEGPTPRTTLGVYLRGSLIVTVSTFRADGEDDTATWQGVVDSMDL